MDDLFGESSWSYEKTDDNKARFVLGEKGENPLICIGANPSTATPEKLDNTLRLVKARAKSLGYDGWIMLNLYPQRATDPNDLHEKYNYEWHFKNIMHIRRCLADLEKVTIWAAWGALIEKRAYLKSLLEAICKSIKLSPYSDISWITIGKRSIKGHPHHPLYLPKDSKTEAFDVKEYLKGLK